MANPEQREVVAQAMASGHKPIDLMPDPLALPAGQYVARHKVVCMAAGDPLRQEIHLAPGDRFTITDNRASTRAELTARATWAMANA